MLFRSWLMRVITPGYTGDKFKLSVMLTQISMPYLPCMAIAALLSGVLNARGRFAVSGLAPTFLNLCMLLAILPQKTPNSSAVAASWGVLAAGLCQVVLFVWAARKAGANIRFALPKLTPEIRTLIGLAIPGAIAASATQINVFISQSFSSHVAGARSWLNVADRFYQLPLGLVGVAVGIALLPALSRSVHAGDKVGAQNAMDEAVNFSMALTLPAAIALVAMPYFLVDGLFTRGAFTHEDARQTASALLHYGWGTPAFVLVRILAPAFFARQDTKGPMFFALASVVVNLAVGISLFHVIGVAGLAVGTSAAAWSNVLLMGFFLARRKAWIMSPAAVSRLVRILLATALMGAVTGFAEFLYRTGRLQPRSTRGIIATPKGLAGPAGDFLSVSPPAATSCHPRCPGNRPLRPHGSDPAPRSSSDRKSTRLNSSHTDISRMPSSA